MEVVADPVHVDVGHDVDRILAAEGATRARLEPPITTDAAASTSSIGTLSSRAIAAEVALISVVEVLGEDPQHERIVDPEHARLDQQALAQVARADAARIELLHRGERRLGDHVLAHAALARDLVDRRREVAAIVEVADDEARGDLLLDRQRGELELPEQVLGERLASRVGRVDRRAVVGADASRMPVWGLASR